MVLVAGSDGWESPSGASVSFVGVFPDFDSAHRRANALLDGEPFGPEALRFNPSSNSAWYVIIDPNSKRVYTYDGRNRPYWRDAHDEEPPLSACIKS